MDGNLYGLSSSTDGYHSTKMGSWYNGGSLWKINPSNGQLTLLFAFTEATTGFWPDGTQPKSLVEGPDGYLYGLASGGSNAYSAGLIFKVSKRGGNFQIVQTDCTGGNAGIHQPQRRGDISISGAGRNTVLLRNIELTLFRPQEIQKPLN